MTRFICYLRDIAFVSFECHKNLKAKASLCLSKMQHLSRANNNAKYHFITFRHFSRRTNKVRYLRDTQISTHSKCFGTSSNIVALAYKLDEWFFLCVITVATAFQKYKNLFNSIFIFLDIRQKVLLFA